MLFFKKLDDRAKMPTRKNPWDAGYDLTIIKPITLVTGRVNVAQTGLAVAIPQGSVGFLTLRSSLGAKGVMITNAPGIIDAGYRGEIKVMLTLVDPTHNVLLLEEGERIAQLIICYFRELPTTFVEELPPSDGRENSGFGSTGKS